MSQSLSTLQLHTQKYLVFFLMKSVYFVCKHQLYSSSVCPSDVLIRWVWSLFPWPALLDPVSSDPESRLCAAVMWRGKKSGLIWNGRRRCGCCCSNQSLAAVSRCECSTFHLSTITLRSLVCSVDCGFDQFIYTCCVCVRGYWWKQDLPSIAQHWCMWRQWAGYICTQYSVLQTVSWNNMVILEHCSHIYRVTRNEIRHLWKTRQRRVVRMCAWSKCLLISLAFINESLCFESLGRSQVHVTTHLSSCLCSTSVSLNGKIAFSLSQMQRKIALNSLNRSTSN